jgi:BlaI family penicillinase repressor
MKKHERITESELIVLNVLWEKSPQSSKEIRQALEDKDWEASTIKTLIARLVKKSILIVDKTSVFTYSPSITKEEYQDMKTKKLLANIFGGNAKSLVANLIGNNDISDDELESISKLIESRRND